MSTDHDHDHDHDHGHEQAHAVGEITQAASAFLGSLSADQKAKATFHYLDGERIFWYTDRKIFVLGRYITDEMLAGLTIPSP